MGSTRTVLPAEMVPASSASRIMLFPMRSFTEQQGSMISSLAAIFAPQPSVTLFRYTMGVLPISSVTSFLMFILDVSRGATTARTWTARAACVFARVFSTNLGACLGRWHDTRRGTRIALTARRQSG